MKKLGSIRARKLSLDHNSLNLVHVLVSQCIGPFPSLSQIPHTVLVRRKQTSIAQHLTCFCFSYSNPSHRRSTPPFRLIKRRQAHKGVRSVRLSAQPENVSTHKEKKQRRRRRSNTTRNQCRSACSSLPVNSAALPVSGDTTPTPCNASN